MLCLPISLAIVRRLLFIADCHLTRVVDFYTREQNSQECSSHVFSRLLQVCKLSLCPGGWANYCDHRVCLFVCLSVRSHIPKTARPNFTNCFRSIWLWLAVLGEIRYVLPVLWMTSCFYGEPMGQNQRQHVCFVEPIVVLLFYFHHFIFFLFFFSVQCARLSWPSRQLLSAR